MILIKIDSLSTQELRNIAEREGIEEYATLDRDDLIQVLREIYEEDDDVADNADVNRRFLYGITDYREIDKDVVELPGVEELPESYPCTEIHLLYKNPNWAYCYWSISPQDLARLESMGKSELRLRVSIFLSLLRTGSGRSVFLIMAGRAMYHSSSILRARISSWHTLQAFLLSSPIGLNIPMR